MRRLLRPAPTVASGVLVDFAIADPCDFLGSVRCQAEDHWNKTHKHECKPTCGRNADIRHIDAERETYGMSSLSVLLGSFAKSPNPQPLRRTRTLVEKLGPRIRSSFSPDTVDAGHVCAVFERILDDQMLVPISEDSDALQAEVTNS